MHDLTHASFFSGVGGLDLGLERAGWRTVSFSEIDPYASAVLAERWPGVPNLGDITDLASRSAEAAGRGTGGHGSYHRPTLWSGGFPCQDLSVAGKRAGFAGERSGLAFAFLDLVEQHRPPAILLENVPGLLSSHGGKDLGALLGRLGDLGYWWAYRILDAQFFGVPQRRRRVFICALHAGSGFGADSAAAVLSVGARCHGHSQAGDEAGQGTTSLTGGGADSPQSERVWSDGGPGPALDTGRAVPNVLSPTPDPGGVREADGMAGRLDDRREVVNPILAGGNGGQRTTDLNTPLVYRKSARVNSDTSPETWVDDGLANTLNSFDVGDIRTTHIALERVGPPVPADGGLGDVLRGADLRGVHPTGERPDALLPLGLDSHRYRCCGNGVVSNVSEWIGVRLARVMA